MSESLKSQSVSSHSILAKAQANLSRYGIVTLVFASVFILLYASLFLGQQAKGNFKLNKYYSFVDSTNEISFQSILQLPDEQWTKRHDLRFKSNTGRVWLKVDIPDTEQQTVLLQYNDPLIDNVIINVVDANNNNNIVTAKYTVGDLQPFAERFISLPYIVIPIDLMQGKTTLYMSASSKVSIDLNFGLWRSEGYIQFHDNLTIFLGLVFGYIFALLSYNILMYATASRIENLWYALYLGGFLLHSMVLSGYGFQYLWPQDVGLQTVMGGVSLSVTLMCLVKFTQKAIAIDTKRFHIFFNVIVYVHLILCVLSIYTLDPIFLNLHFIAVLLTSLLLPVVCIYAHSNDSNTNVLFALIWLAFSLTLWFSFSVKVGVVSLNLDPLYILFFGFHLQTLLIGSALVYEYRVTAQRTLELEETVLIEKEKIIKAKDEILNLQQDAQAQLALQVKAQTLQLEGALSELSLASSELKNMRNVDGLTGLPNRLAFEDEVQKLSRKSIGMGTALCVAVLDIDHFKKVNDTYGHIAGDDCLRKFSAVMKELFQTEHYACCRFGGEEFILSSTLPMADVVQQVNVFKGLIENMIVETGAYNISFTTSAGVACKRLINEADARSLFALADEKLYLAKQKGRNLVIA